MTDSPVHVRLAMTTELFGEAEDMVMIVDAKSGYMYDICEGTTLAMDSIREHGFTLDGWETE